MTTADTTLITADSTICYADGLCGTCGCVTDLEDCHCSACSPLTWNVDGRNQGPNIVCGLTTYPSGIGHYGQP